MRCLAKYRSANNGDVLVGVQAADPVNDCPDTSRRETRWSSCGTRCRYGGCRSSICSANGEFAGSKDRGIRTALCEEKAESGEKARAGDEKEGQYLTCFVESEDKGMVRVKADAGAFAVGSKTMNG